MLTTTFRTIEEQIAKQIPAEDLLNMLVNHAKIADRYTFQIYPDPVEKHLTVVDMEIKR